MISSVEGQTYASVSEKTGEKKNLTTKLIALFSSILKEGKKIIVKEEGQRIVVRFPDDIIEDVKSNTVIFMCKKMRVGGFAIRP